MDTEVNTAAPISLHPQVFEFDRLDDDGRLFTANAVAAFTEAVAGLSAVDDVRAAAAANPALTEAGRILAVSAFAAKKVEAIEKKILAADTTLTKQIEFTEGELSKPLEMSVHSLTAQELRGIVRAMPDADRRKLVQEALDTNDMTVIGSVLGAHPLLSGLSQLDKDHFTQAFNKKSQPQLASRLDVMLRTQKILRERIGLVQKSADKLIGADQKRVTFLRSADSKLSKALAK